MELGRLLVRLLPPRGLSPFIRVALRREDGTPCRLVALVHHRAQIENVDRSLAPWSTTTTTAAHQQRHRYDRPKPQHGTCFWGQLVANRGPNKWWAAASESAPLTDDVRQQLAADGGGLREAEQSEALLQLPVGHGTVAVGVGVADELRSADLLGDTAATTVAVKTAALDRSP